MISVAATYLQPQAHISRGIIRIDQASNSSLGLLRLGRQTTNTYAIGNNHICHLLIDLLKTSRVIFPAGAVLLSLSLFFANSISSFSKKKGLGDCGTPGKMTNPMNATGIVIMPSMINSHLHPLRPPTPLRLVYAAACK